MSKVVLHGIKNCDTVKKAQKWLKEHDIEFTFHDFRQDGLDESQLGAWLKKVEPKILVNTRSTTWKGLNDQQKEEALSGTVAQVILEQPTLIKRPVLTMGQQVEIGFKPEAYQTIFNI